MTISPAWNGFLKGLLLVVVAAGASYLGDSAHLAPIMGGSAAEIVAGLVSAFESAVRASTGNGLLGLSKVR